MGSTIESLWLGELCPGEIPPKKTKETDDIIQNINKNKAALKNMLNNEQNNILKELLMDLDFLYLLRRSEEFEKGLFSRFKAPSGSFCGKQIKNLHIFLKTMLPSGE